MPGKKAKAPRKNSGPSRSSSAKTEKSKQSKALLELGNRLVQELGDGDQVYTTSNWMAHYLAELISAAETDTGRKPECARLILEVWRTRHWYPHDDPLTSYQRSLESLDAFLGANAGIFRPLSAHRKKMSASRDSWEGVIDALRHRSDQLRTFALQFALENSALDDDELLEIAHLADPDPQSQLLTQLRLIGLDGEGNQTHDNTRDFVLEALAALESTIASFRKLYLERSHSGDE